ncbi:MAG: hypothetical protein HQ523_09525 [Lentisphaerae bacterium]|nr:hypothetical protein [Lentisphaerota bacterium]
MSELAKYSVAMGAVLAPLYLAMVIAPAVALKGWRAFPRNRPMAVILSAISFAWVGWLLHQTPMGRFETLRQPITLSLPVVCVLVNIFSSELLAPRALGGIMILVPAPLLAAARWHPSPWRYVMLVLAYALVVKGIALILSPFLFRRGMERIVKDVATCRAWGGLGVAMALLLIVLGLTVY